MALPFPCDYSYLLHAAPAVQPLHMRKACMRNWSTQSHHHHHPAWHVHEARMHAATTAAYTGAQVDGVRLPTHHQPRPAQHCSARGRNAARRCHCCSALLAPRAGPSQSLLRPVVTTPNGLLNLQCSRSQIQVLQVHADRHPSGACHLPPQHKEAQHTPLQAQPLRATCHTLPPARP